jgi:acyl dehydratase
MTDESGSDGNRRLKEGWFGRYYEDFDVGDVYKHPYGRTITETDDVWLTNISMNLNPMHFNEPYAAGTEFGERLVNSAVTFMIGTGMSVIDVSQNSTAALGFDNIRMHEPVFHGDTLFSESEVIFKRESESRDYVGIVTTELRIFNQDGDMVMSLERSNFILKREHEDPDPAQPPGWPEGIGTQPEDLE